MDIEQIICRDCTKVSFSISRCQKCNSPRILKHDELFSLNIAHIDCDAFYASVEKKRNPKLINKPVIVGGGIRGVVTTCCYIARIKGVKSAMPIFKAKKLCPEAIIIPPEMSFYKKISNLIFEKFYKLTPLVETIAYDEAYLDFSGTYNLHKKKPAELLVELSREVEEELGITISIGLSENKFLAKLASSIKKPRAFTIIGKSEKLEIINKMSINKIPGVGPTIQKKFNLKSIKTIGDMTKLDQETLMKSYGNFGITIWNLVRGIDKRKISPINLRKSISKEKTFETDIFEYHTLKKTLWLLSEEVSEIQKKNNIICKTIVLKLKQHNFKNLTFSYTFLEPTNLAEHFFQATNSILKTKIKLAPFRLIGLSSTKLLLDQKGLFSNFHLESKYRKLEKAERTVDNIRQKFGKKIIKKGRSFN